MLAQGELPVCGWCAGCVVTGGFEQGVCVNWAGRAGVEIAGCVDVLTGWFGGSQLVKDAHDGTSVC